MPQTLRAFVAVPIPEAVALFLMQIQARLQLPGRNIRWVAAKNIHLTLKFLGDVDPVASPCNCRPDGCSRRRDGRFFADSKGGGGFPGPSPCAYTLGWVGG